MPETYFRVRWPDGRIETYYSPSTIIRTFFELGTSYPVEEFLRRSRAGLLAAGDRVFEQYGMRCSRALAQLAAIEAKANKQPAGAAPVLVEAFST